MGKKLARDDSINIIKVNNYKAKIEYDPEIDMFRGEIPGLNGEQIFMGKILLSYVRN